MSYNCYACPTAQSRCLVEGKKRGRIVRHVGQTDCFWAEVDEIEEGRDRLTEVEALMRTYQCDF